MSKKIGNEEQKIKGKFLINIESRTDEKKIKFTKWLNAQTNPQNSFLSLIEHCIDRFGYEDVTDHEIAKRLHTEILYFNNNDVPQTNIKMVEANNLKMDNEVEKEKIEIKKQVKKVSEVEPQEDPEDDNNIIADLNSF
ncbi:hypothetical protein M3175_20595 [Robertmurraya korlensis]|uniref:hypothetical protein n=1 Tax=Robertmurraya korlensis TaxID=519977 RepID=UPI00203ABDB1|nr:hypothetical protein [Robertmurraya korlensis]MCM3603142.1 hypothetical protein [Robertmurraya korlensis]